MARSMKGGNDDVQHFGYQKPDGKNWHGFDYNTSKGRY